MKKLLIPVVIAVLAGVGGGSGFAYMSASKAYVADSTQFADSLKAHPPAADSALSDHGDPSAAHGEPSVVDVANDSTTDASAPTADAHGTPADSVRAVATSRAAAGHTETKPPVTPTKKDSTKTEAGADTQAKATATSVANIVRDARNEAMTTALPEQRLAKIFAAMAAKDAAKVLDQMPDADVRLILSLMNDRTAAGILVQFAPARAASITKGTVHPPAPKP